MDNVIEYKKPYISVRPLLMLLFLMGAITALSGCGQPSFKSNKEERRERLEAFNQDFEMSCPIEDCSALPIGYHTVEIGGEWLYIPIPKWHPYREEHDGSPIDVSIRPRTRHVAQYDLGEGVPRSRAQLRTVTVGARVAEFGRCCSTYELLYDLPAGALDLGFGLFKLSFPEERHRWDMTYTSEVIEAWALDKGYTPLNDDFFVRSYPPPGASTGSGKQSSAFHAVSRQPILLGEPVTVRCFSQVTIEGEPYACSLDSGLGNIFGGPGGGIGPDTLIVRLRDTSVFRVVDGVREYCGGFECHTHEAKEATLEIILERVATIEKIIELFRQHPDERANSSGP